MSKAAREHGELRSYLVYFMAARSDSATDTISSLTATSDASAPRNAHLAAVACVVAALSKLARSTPCNIRADWVCLLSSVISAIADVSSVRERLRSASSPANSNLTRKTFGGGAA